MASAPFCATPAVAAYVVTGGTGVPEPVGAPPPQAVSTDARASARAAYGAGFRRRKGMARQARWRRLVDLRTPCQGRQSTLPSVTGQAREAARCVAYVTDSGPSRSTQ